jgi:hypothetical protein
MINNDTSVTGESKKPVRAHQHLMKMLATDPELYDRILDTPTFAYHFNQIVNIAVRVDDPK